MNLLRKILFPFAILYTFITNFRNLLFDIGILKSHSFPVPVIAVGNLSVGGAGKTPQIEYLIRLLSPNYKVATLSRGYKRESKGFILADSNSNATILGDEPFQFYSKFKNIQVAVDADRKNGIEQILSRHDKPEVILLDDAFQHRKVKAGFYILLTSYGDLYSDDFLLPTGNLRESRIGAERANLIIVTKCPANISFEEQNKIKNKLNLSNNQQLYFSFVDYDDFVYSETDKIPLVKIKNESKLLIAGIAKPKTFFDYLTYDDDVCLTFQDHHQFDDKDIDLIQNKAKNRVIITTEKDYVRLRDKLAQQELYYLPIQSSFITRANQFDETILDYVNKYKPQSS